MLIGRERMVVEGTSVLFHRGRQFAIGVSVSAALVGMLVLVGWAVDYRLLTRVKPGNATVMPNSAVGFILAAIALWCRSLSFGGMPSPKPWHATLADICAVLTGLLGLATLLEYLTGLDFGLDALLFRRRLAEFQSPYLGRMSPETAICLCLLGATLRFLDVRTRDGRWPAQAFALTNILFAGTALYGYFFGLRAFYGFRSTTAMALPNAALFVGLGVGSLSVRPNRGFLAVIRSERIGGALARRVLPWIALMPAFRWLLWEGEMAGWYTPEFCAAIFTCFTQVVLSLVVWRGAHWLNAEDANRERAEEELRTSETQFRTLANTIPQLCWIANAEGRISWYNQRWQEYTGLNPGQTEGSYWQALLEPEVSRKVAERWKHSVENGSPFDMVFPIRGADGIRRAFLTRVMPVSDREGKVVRWFGTNTDINEQQRAAAEIRRTKDLLETFVKSAPLGLAMFDREMRYVRTSDRWLEVMGIEDRSIVGKSHYDVFPGLPEYWRNIYRRGLAGEAQKGEDEWVALDGQKHSIRWQIEPWGDLGVQTGGIIISLEDITERKRTDLELRKFVSLADHSMEFIGMCDLDRRAFYVNQAGLRLVGLDSLEQLSGTDMMEFFFPEDRPFIADEFIPRVLREGRAEVEIRFRHFRTGQPIWMIYNVFHIKDCAGHPIGFATVSRDITTRKQAELRLQIEERRLAALIDNAMDAIITMDEDQRVILFNTAAENIFGCSAREVLGKPLDRFLPERVRKLHHRYVQVFGASASNARSMQPQKTLYGVRANGQEFPLEATISKVTVDGQKLFTVILRDVTERKHAEELERLYARTREMDRVKTEFFANISHDFRTPLTLLLNPLEDLLRNSGSSISVPRSDLELMRRNSLRLLKMVNTLLDLSRIDAGRLEGEFEPSDLAELTAEYTSVFRSIVESAGLYLDMQVKALDEPVYVDRTMWEKVVLNLLSNAFKFTLTGGITVRLKRNGAFAELTVADSGIGIPQAELPRIFDRFHRVEGSRGRSFEGTGIGLALVHELVKLHGGSIEVRSELDRGTTFTVSIPFGTAHLPADLNSTGTLQKTTTTRPSDLEDAQPKILGPQSVDSTKMPQCPTSRSEKPFARILLADDNADMRGYITRLLAPTYEVEPVADGEEAMKAALRKCPDLVLTDVMMPKMNGMQLLRELRKHPAMATIPVIMLSARAGDEPLMGLETGADDYVIKPFSAEQLLARVRSHVALARLREEAKSAVTQSEARFRQLLEVAPEAILEVGEDGRILLVNEAAEQMFGYNRDEFLTLHVDALVPDAQRENHALYRLHYTRKPNRRPMGSGLQLNAQRKDHSLFPVEISLSPIHSNDAVRVIALVRDVTDRRKAEAQLEANRAQLVSSARLASLGKMAGGIAHEINNPLAIIHASADDLLRRAKQSAPVPLEIVLRNGERIQQTADRIARIIKSMRRLAREGSRDRLCSTQVSKIVEESLEVCRERFRDHSVKLLLPPIDPELHVYCREVQIAQVLVNLLQNAFDAVLEQPEDRWIRLDVRLREDAVVFSVIDSGRGVPPEVKARIMEPFFTTKGVGKGTGLGLSISRTIIEEHSGKLELTEEAGHTCFSFRLPRSPETKSLCN
jgi:PAS domain S-box-containing protein